MVKKILQKIKDAVLKKKKKETVERRRTERRKAERRWLGKLLGDQNVPYERRSGGDRRIGDRRKK